MHLIRDSRIATAATLMTLALCALPVVAAADEVIKDRRVIVLNDNGKVFVSEDGDDAPGAKRGYIGVSLVDLTPELRTYFGVADDTGVLVSEAVKGSPAEKAGIRAGDVIVSLDGKRVDSPRDIGESIRSMKKGDTVKVDVRRKGTAQQFLVTLDEREVKRFELEVGGPRWQGFDAGAFKSFDLDPEMRGAIGNLKDYFESPEWKARMESFRNCDEFEKKIDDLEKRLKALEKQLPKN